VLTRFFISIASIGALAGANPASAAPPNIVLIVSDDQGWADYSFMGHPHIKTPRIDKLASESLRFRRGYVPSSLCSPSLASILSGRYPHQHGVTGNDPPRALNPRVGREELVSFFDKTPMLPRILSENGYVSFQTGKWWGGHFKHGGFTDGMSHGDPAKGGRHGDDGLTIGRKTMKPAFDFIDKAVAEKKPFLLWYAPMLPHSPHNPPERLLAKYKDKAPSLQIAKYWAMVEWFDETCGRLLDHLTDQKIDDNTLVIYITDNGWIQDPDADRYAPRSKQSPYDGGLRTPILARFPGKIPPSESTRLASSLDIVPTILDVVGVKRREGLSGINLLDDAKLAARDTIFGEIFAHDIADLHRPAASLRFRWAIEGPYKLIVPDPKNEPNAKVELFNVERDPGETTDLSKERPEVVKRLRKKIDAWWPVDEIERVSTPSASRGAEVVRKPLNPPFWSLRAYDEAWKRWGVAEKPADYDRAFREYYGLHAAPYDNAGLPMGIHRAKGLLGMGQAIGNDCLICHGGTVAGKTIVGLGNTSFDLQSLYEDLYAADGVGPYTPLQVSHVRGTSEASNFAIYLMQFRDTELKHRIPVRYPIKAVICEDVPAWWLFKKKTTIYHLGVADSRSIRTMMPFLLIPTASAQSIKSREAEFADLREYLLSVEAPKYPFEIDRAVAERGKAIFEGKCAKCHGTYGPDGAYPNTIVPLEKIGTDPTLATAFDETAVKHYLNSWFAKERGPNGEPYHGLNGGGYQAPPLDGLWATAPYFHNGSVPTVYHVLNSTSRPNRFTRSFRGRVEDFDQERFGVRIVEVEKPVDPNVPGIERRKVYDTAEPGRGNQGHTFGDALSERDRMAVIEYLKTL